MKLKIEYPTWNKGIQVESDFNRRYICENGFKTWFNGYVAPLNKILATAQSVYRPKYANSWHLNKQPFYDEQALVIYNHAIEKDTSHKLLEDLVMDYLAADEKTLAAKYIALQARAKVILGEN